MSIYYLFLFCVILVSSGVTSKSKHISKFFYFLCAMLLTLISGLRLDVGTDYQNYLYLFNLIENGQLSVSEPGLVYLYKFSNYLGFGSYGVFFVFSFIVAVGFTKFLSDFCGRKGGVAIFLFFTLSMFYFASFNLIRQYAAVSVILYGFKYILEKRFLVYLIYVGIAMLFHYSAIVMLSMYFLLGRKYTYKHLFFLTALFLLSFSIIKYLATFTSYGIYLTREFEHSANLFVSLLFGCACLFFLFLRDSLSETNNCIVHERKIIILTNMAYLSFLMVIGAVFSGLPQIVFLRFNYFFMPSILALACLFLSVIKNSYVKVIYLSCLFSLGLAYFVYTVQLNGFLHKIVPYKSIL
jgi:hypothetical protein